jgi:hypothetical protein
MSAGKYIRLIVLTLLGLACVILAARSRYHDGLLEAFGLLFIGVPAAILFLVSLVLDAKA